MIDYISQFWHSVNGWTNQQKWILSYSTDNQLLDWTTQFWYTTQWENYIRLRSVYDTNGNMVIYAWENWENSAWQNHIQLLFTYVPITNVEEENIKLDQFSLSQNYPNPFNPSTKISWQSPTSGWQTLKIYDVLGNEIVTLVNEYKSTGSYEIEFDASGLTSGVYFYKLQVESFIETKKMILLR
ncbi:MAG: T9SS type A sorting domain-containing protein [Ignavibacteriales bacterium]|nr:T9SS type A sorting domain-containing protein [Ignavibacteriales bacterium]